MGRASWRSFPVTGPGPARSFVERIARIGGSPVAARGLLRVDAGVGTRHYYRKLGFELEGPYMTKLL